MAFDQNSDAPIISSVTGGTSYCTNCGAAMDPAASVCISCGVAKNKVRHFCANCGASVQENQDVCLSCGSRLHGGGFAGRVGGPVGSAPAGDVSWGGVIASVLFPIVGLILFIIWKDSRPAAARAAGIAALVSFILYFFIIGCSRMLI